MCRRKVWSVVAILLVFGSMIFFAGSPDQMNCQVTIRVNGKKISSYDNLKVKVYKEGKLQKVTVASDKKQVKINWEPDIDKYFLKLQMSLKDEIGNVPDMNAVMDYDHFPDGTSTVAKWDINYVQEHGKWIVQHTCKMKMGDKKEITDTYKFKPDEKQFLYYGV